MTGFDDDLLFLDDEDSELATRQLPPWKVLLVDDDAEVHSVTKLVLTDFEWDSRRLEFYDAYSAQEALTILREHPDIAVALVDVVMESDDAGLQLIRTIREQLHNHSIRLVLRTGQPGQAPERTVIREYDVSDYKHKTELSGIKLDTLMCASLRAYRDLIELERSRRGLEYVIQSATKMLSQHNIPNIARITLESLQKLLYLSEPEQDHPCSGIVLHYHLQQADIVNGSHLLRNAYQQQDLSLIPLALMQLIDECYSLQQVVEQDDQIAIYLGKREQFELVIALSDLPKLHNLNPQVLSLFIHQTNLALEHDYLRGSFESNMAELIFSIADLSEHNPLANHHARRVAMITALLARGFGFQEEEMVSIQIAASLHDIGKTNISAELLNKTEPLSPDEWQKVRHHTELIDHALQFQQHRIARYVRIIATQHHEHWNGQGYPLGLKGDQIHILGRITAAVDCIDAMMSPRQYRPPCTLDEALAYLHQQSGKQFDPRVVDALQQQLPEIMVIYRQYPPSTN